MSILWRSLSSYEKKMQEMYKHVTATLKQRTQAIVLMYIGLSVDIDDYVKLRV